RRSAIGVDKPQRRFEASFRHPRGCRPTSRGSSSCCRRARHTKPLLLLPRRIRECVNPSPTPGVSPPPFGRLSTQRRERLAASASVLAEWGGSAHGCEETAGRTASR